MLAPGLEHSNGLAALNIQKLRCQREADTFSFTVLPNEETESRVLEGNVQGSWVN